MRVADVTTQYAIDVPGRGLIGWMGFSANRDVSGFETLDEAREAMNSWIKKYASMGCPEVGATLQVIRRTATITFGDWAPVQLVST